MNYGDLEFPEEELAAKFLPKSKEQREARLHDSKRYVITCDPYDEDTIRQLQIGRNVFIVYDKLNQCVNTKIITKKSFDEYVASLVKGEAKGVPYVVSKKFIINGRPANLGEANPGSEPSKRYNDTF